MASIRLFSLKGSSFRSRTTCQQVSSVISVIVGVHRKPILDDPTID
uniref:Uncharacterized protein n=1 Tax=Arundo donax TaxID=35708 RepID=A0A0A8ZRY2_ARUDO